MDDMRKSVRECHWCGNHFTDDRGIVQSGQDAVEGIKSMFGKKVSQEEANEKAASWTKKAEGVGIATEGTPEGEAFLAELQARRDQAGKTADDTPAIEARHD